MPVTTHDQLIRDTVAALVVEYRERRPRCPLETHVAHGLAQRVGVLDAAEQKVVDEMLKQATAPREWDGTVWRGASR